VSDYFKVKQDARSKGPLPVGASSPIAILPGKEFSLTRNIVVPVTGPEGKKIRGKYAHHPAIITVVAFTAGEASARADEIQANARIQAWGNSSRPWDSGDWTLVEVPSDAKPLELR